MAIKMLLPLMAAILIGAPSFAADTTAGRGQKTLIEMHQKMAAAHKKAAACLKAGRAVDECNREAMKQCPLTNTEKCPFMDNMETMMNDMKKEHKGMMQGETNRK